jgi:hypothetical protein
MGICSELGCGMPAEAVERASSSDENWLTNGRWGVVQFHTPATGTSALASAADGPQISRDGSVVYRF